MPEKPPLADRSEALRPLRRAFWTGIAALLGVGAALGSLAIVQADGTERVRHGREVARVARQAFVLAVDRETGLRGFLLSHDSRSLAPEQSARVRLPLKLDTLEALTTDNPAQQARARAVRVAIDRWDREVAQPLLSSSGAIRPGASDRLAGRRQFDEVRATFREFLRTEDTLYYQRVAWERTIRRATLIVGALALAFLLVVFLRLRRSVVSQANGLLEQQELLEGQAVELELQTEELQAQTQELLDQTRAATLAMDEVALQRRFLREVIDTIPAFVFVKDRAGRFTLANRALGEAYGTTSEGLVGRTDAEFSASAVEVAAFRRDELEVLQSGRDLRIPEEAVTDVGGGVRWLETIKRPLLIGDGPARHILGVSIDITARKQAEAALHDSEDRLRQAQKMEAIGRLAGGIAHDFNNVLTAIRSYSEFLLEDLDTSDPHREDVEEINKASARASTLVRQLLAFSRQQVLQPRALDLNATVGDLAPMLGRLVGADVRLQVRLAPTLGVVLADPGQLEQVLVNLVVNARDAMPDGGELTVETANADLGDGHSTSGMPVDPGPYVVLVVTDTGTGMDSATREQVFDPFFTTKPVGQGTGLGLATVYGIVKQSGGYVWVYSEMGHGTTFKIYLPRVDAMVESLDADVGEACAPAQGSGTILLVEDDSAVRAAAHRALTRAGYTLIVAPDGAEALARCTDSSGPRIDLVVTDLVMPEMGGLQLGAALRGQRLGARILYMSGYTRDAMMRQSLLEPGAAFLEKPFTPEALVRRVQALLAAGVPGDASANGAQLAGHSG